MKLENYNVKKHTFGVFSNESQLNEQSLRDFNIIKNHSDLLIADIIRRINNLYCLNQFDAESTLKDLLLELKSLNALQEY
jgi:hypothetical protein